MVAAASLTLVETLADFEERRISIECLFLRMLHEGLLRGSTLPFDLTTENVARFFEAPLKIAFENDDAIAVMSEAGDRDIGMHIATIDRGPFSQVEVTAFGHGTYVEPEFRQRGLATQMRQTAENWLHARGVRLIVGQLDLHDPGALRSANKQGYHCFSALVRKRL